MLANMIFPLPNGCAVSGLNETEGACPVCGKLSVSEPNGFAFLAGGAFRRESNQSSAMEPNLEGFLSVGFPGAHFHPHSYPMRNRAASQIGLADMSRLVTSAQKEALLGC